MEQRAHLLRAKNVKPSELYVYTSNNNLQHVFNIDQMGFLTNYMLFRYISNMWISVGSNIQFGIGKMILPYVNFPWVKKMKRDILFELANLQVMCPPKICWKVLASRKFPFHGIENLFSAHSIPRSWCCGELPRESHGLWQCNASFFLHVSYSINQGFW